MMDTREAVALALCGADNVLAERRTGIMPTKCKSACADCIAAADAAIAAHLKSLADAGMVVVPREPTEAMLTDVGTMDGCDCDRRTADADHIKWWKDMIAAGETITTSTAIQYKDDAGRIVEGETP